MNRFLEYAGISTVGWIWSKQDRCADILRWNRPIIWLANDRTRSVLSRYILATIVFRSHLRYGDFRNLFSITAYPLCMLDLTPKLPQYSHVRTCSVVYIRILTKTTQAWTIVHEPSCSVLICNDLRNNMHSEVKHEYQKIYLRVSKSFMEANYIIFMRKYEESHAPTNKFRKK